MVGKANVFLVYEREAGDQNKVCYKKIERLTSSLIVNDSAKLGTLAAEII